MNTSIFRIPRLTFLILGIAGVPSYSWAATLNATSCSQSVVQAAINSAASGDTVLLPTCSSTTWSSTVTIPSSKGITLNGNGGTISGKVDITQNSTVSSRVTNFKFTNQHAVYFHGTPSSATGRFDHSTINVGTTGSAILVETEGNAPVLIDHNTFTGGGASEIIHNYGTWITNSSTYNIAGWNDDVTPGGPNMVFIEDNTFNNAGATGNPAYFWGYSAVQSYYGARTVVRHNTMNMATVDQHGTPGMVGARWWEIYENTFYIVQNGNQDKYVGNRAGSGVIFNNHKTGYANQGAGSISLYEEDSGYPALFQIGRGKNGTLDPAYVWGNDSSMSVVSDSSNVQVNRDYYQSAKPNYTPYTYPHPMVAGTSAPAPAPAPVPTLAAPTNLKAS